MAGNMFVLIHLVAVTFFGFNKHVCLAADGGLAEASVLVTGAAGFVGSHLVMDLVKQGCKSVVAIDSFDVTNDPYLKYLRADLVATTTNVKIIHGDMCNKTFSELILRRTELTHVVLLAAQVGAHNTSTYPLSSEYFYDHGSCFTSFLEQIVLRYKDNRPKVLYASPTAALLPHELPFFEDEPVVHPSGATRAEEQIADFYSTNHKLSITGFRFSSVYGPYSRQDATVSVFTENIISGKPIVLFNQGKVQRYHTFIDDIVNGLTAFIAQKPDNGHLVYDLGSTVPLSTDYLLSLVEGYLGKKANVQNKESTISMSVPIIMNTSLAENHIKKYYKKTSVESGLKKYVDWHVAYEVSLTPCMSECSNDGFCFESGWEDAAKISRELTAKCTNVFYTVASHERTDRLWPAPGDNVGCNIVFLNESSVLYRSILATGGNTHKNWTAIPLQMFVGFKDTRKPTRVPKLNPGKFFSKNVKYAVYGDTSIQLKLPLHVVIEEMVVRNFTQDRAVFAAIRHTDGFRQVEEEAKNVIACSKKRKHVTFYSEKLKHEAHAYKSMRRKYIDLKLNNIFDGSFLVHDLTSPVGKEFRCRWYREYQMWADRDQVSGGYSISAMNYEYDKSNAGKRADWLAVGKDVDKNLIYAHVLREEEHSWHNGKLYKKNEFGYAA